MWYHAADVDSALRHAAVAAGTLWHQLQRAADWLCCMRAPPWQVLDATKAFKKLLTDKQDVEGLPESGARSTGRLCTSTGCFWWFFCVRGLSAINSLHPILRPLIASRGAGSIALMMLAFSHRRHRAPPLNHNALTGVSLCPPPAALALAAQQAIKEGHEGATPESGPWLFTLDMPSYFPVMTHAKNRWAAACSLLAWLALVSSRRKRPWSPGSCDRDHFFVRALLSLRVSALPGSVACSCPAGSTLMCSACTAPSLLCGAPCVQGAARGAVPGQHHARLLWRHQQRAHHREGAHGLGQ